MLLGLSSLVKVCDLLQSLALALAGPSVDVPGATEDCQMTTQQQTALEEARAEAVQQGLLKAERERSMVRRVHPQPAPSHQRHVTRCLASAQRSVGGFFLLSCYPAACMRSALPLCLAPTEHAERIIPPRAPPSSGLPLHSAPQLPGTVRRQGSGASSSSCRSSLTACTGALPVSTAPSSSAALPTGPLIQQIAPHRRALASQLQAIQQCRGHPSRVAFQ